MTYIPVVIEKSSTSEVGYDIFSRLLKERIIFLDSEITNQNVNLWIAELLFLTSKSDLQVLSPLQTPLTQTLGQIYQQALSPPLEYTRQ